MADTKVSIPNLLRPNKENENNSISTAADQSSQISEDKIKPNNPVDPQDPEEMMFQTFKDKFKGFDDQGNAIVDDGGKLASFSGKDFSKFNQRLKDQYGDKSYEDEFAKQQFQDITNKGNTFQGFAGDQAIFRNEQGDLENFGNTGSYSRFLKKFNPAQFDINKQGQSGRSNAAYGANTGFLGQRQAASQRTGSGINAMLGAQSRTAKNMLNPTNVQNDTPPTPSPVSTQATQAPIKPQSGFEIKPQESKTASLATHGAQVKPSAQSSAQPSVVQLGTNLLQNKANEALKSELTQGTQALSQTSGLPTQAITNPQQYALNQATQAGANALGISSQAITNPQQFALTQATQTGASALGIDPTAITNPAEFARKQAINNLANATGVDNQYLNTALGLLSGGNVGKNVQNLALDQAKKEAVNQAALAAGLDPTGGLATAALNAGKAIFGGGSSTDKGSALAQTGAKAALAGLTGGLVTPETVGLASALSQKAEKGLGDAGFLLSPTSQALDVGSKALTEGLGAAGTIGGRAGRSFSQAGEGVKSLTKGNIGEGLKSLGSAAGNMLMDALIKNPASLAKSAWNVGGNVIHGAGKAVGSVIKGIKKLFCFAPNTPILMADGKYKKIKDIKVGEEVMLGGKVTAITSISSDDLYTYNGVEVSGGHAVYEDGKWTRVKDSKYSVKIDLTEEATVYPMNTEKHLIVTKNQIWADLEEITASQDKSDEEIIVELNKQKQANMMLDVFLKQYFGKNSSKKK
jgi:hypothetical protein